MIPFYRPPKLQAAHTKRLSIDVKTIIDSGMLSNDVNCRILEERVKKMYGVEHVISCSSGTVGLWIAVQSLPRMPVTIPAYEWRSLSYVLGGRKVKYVDIDSLQWHVPTHRTDLSRVNIVNHTFGSVPYTRTGLVLYDAAHSLGAEIKDFGDATVFSLSPSKPATSCEGGLILTNNNDLAGKMLSMRDAVSRLSEVNAVVGLAYLSQIQRTVKRKRLIVNYYREKLKNFTFQEIPISSSYSVCNVVCAPLPKDGLMLGLLKMGVETRAYHMPLCGGFPNTDFVFNNSFALPCYPDVDEREVVDRVLTVADGLRGSAWK